MSLFQAQLSILLEISSLKEKKSKSDLQLKQLPRLFEIV